MRLSDSKHALRAATAVCVLATLAVFVATLRDARRDAGVDLRAKAVGARLLLDHRNPYPDPAAVQPDPYLRLFNTDTYSPALLALYGPLSGLRYSSQRVIYFLLDWVCVVLLFWLTRMWFPPPIRLLHILLFTLLVVADYALRLHVDLGQYYLAMAVLIAAAISAWRREGDAALWAGGAALALLILVRPTFLFLLPVLYLERLRRQFRRTVLVACALLAAMLAGFGTAPWYGYFAALQTLEQQEVGSIFATDAAATTPADTADAYPANYGEVEGQDFSRQVFSNYAVSRTSVSLCAVQRSIRPACARLFRSAAVFSGINAAALALAAVYCVLLAWLLRGCSVELKLGFAFLTPILLESFGPQRYAYCDVTLAPVLLLIFAMLLRRSADCWVRSGAAIVVGVCGLSAIGPYFLSSGGRPILVLSLCRWMVLLVFANVVLARAALASARARAAS